MVLLQAALLKEPAPTVDTDQLLLAETQNQSLQTTKTYSTFNKYNYRLEKPFDRSPDSFAAWIKLPVNSVGGTIMGNFYNTYYGYPGSVNWEIDPIGRLKLFWNNGSLVHTVRKVYLDDGAWHHVAVVRDKDAGTFSFYIDGELVDVVHSKQQDAVSNMPMNIGVDYRNWNASKEPFDGKIRQITVYNGPIS